MTRIDRATEIAIRLKTHPEGERETVAEAECGSDSELRALVNQMLSSEPAPSEQETRVLDTQVMAAEAAASQGVRYVHSEGSRGVVTVREASSDLSGQRLGSYELLKRIGRGGMGSVYSARRVDEFTKTVAVKVVKPGMETEEILLRFKHERQVLASLDHPNIARLLDGGTANGLPYLVMEFVEGTAIDVYCTEKRLSVTDRLNLFCEVCCAVQYAHQSLVVHRDLKPSNILVTADGHSKLLDFGIAKVLNADFSEASAMTQASERPMTPDYASPEQVRGEPITTSSDVYALGVLLYQLLTDQHPFRHLFRQVGFHKTVCEVDAERPSTAADRLPDTAVMVAEGHRAKLRERLRGDLDEIVMMALRKEPQRRYASVQHLADDIHRHLQGMPVRAHRDSLGYRTRKFVRRHTAAVLSGAAVALALLTSSIVTWTFYHQAARQRERAELRFSDVRELARFVLFDFDRAIARGVTPARKALIEKATEYLGRLEQDASADASLEKEIVEGYLKVGDLQGNLYGPNLGDRSAARASYERALRILDRSRTRDVALRVQARMKLADLLQQSGSPRAAIEAYGRARQTLEDAGVSDPEKTRIYLDVLQKEAFVHSQMGEYAEAVELYQKVLQSAARTKQPDDVTRLTILAERRMGEMMARMGNVDEGLTRMLHAVEAYEKRAAATPGVAAAQRAVATSSALVGDILVLSQRYPEAAVRFRRALQVTEGLAFSDPANEQFQRDLSSYLARLADAVARSGKMEDARALTRRALQVLRPLLSKGAEIDVYQYAWILLTTPCTDLRDGATALGHAEHLVKMTREEDPRTLDLLARAQAATGQLARAIETDARALKLLPADTASDLKKEIESNLALFRSGAANPGQTR